MMSKMQLASPVLSGEDVEDVLVRCLDAHAGALHSAHDSCEQRNER